MLDDMGIIKYLEAAMRAEGLRQSMIANNMSNINTPGYRRFDIRFEEFLAEAMESGGPVDLTHIKPEIFQPLNTPVNTNGNDISLDMEVGELVKNSLRHKTFVRLLRRRYEQLQLAMNVK